MHVHIDATIDTAFFNSFISFTHNGYSGFGLPAFVEYFKKNCTVVLCDSSPDAAILKKKANIVYKTPLLPGTGVPFSNIVVKKCLSRNIVMFLISPFRKSKAQRSFNAARHLLSHNCDTPHPLACIEKRKWGFITESYYITEFVDHCVKVKRFVRQYPEGKEELQTLLYSVADYVSRMHDAGMIHRDCNLANFLVSGEGDEKRLILIDLNRYQVKKHISAFARVCDIGRLYWRELRPEFFRIYCTKHPEVSQWEWFFNFYYTWRKKRRKVKNWLRTLF